MSDDRTVMLVCSLYKDARDHFGDCQAAGDRVDVDDFDMPDRYHLLGNKHPGDPSASTFSSHRLH